MFLDPKLLATGIGIGLIVSAPVGPVNILCIQRTLQRGFWGGVAAGFGAILGDGLIATVAAFGITAISGLMSEYKLAIQLIGGAILIAFGLKLCLAHPKAQAAENQQNGLTSNGWIVPQTFFLTITNPGAVLGLLAIFSGVGSLIGGIQSYMNALTIVLAVMTGAALWWFGLSSIIATIRHKLNESRLRVINLTAGLVLICFGIALVLEPYLGLQASFAL